MESPLSPVRMHWDHEPESGPLTPSLSPSEGGEGAQAYLYLALRRK